MGTGPLGTVLSLTESRHYLLSLYIKILFIFSHEHATKASILQKLLKGFDCNDLPTDVQELVKELEALYTIAPQNVEYTIREIKTWTRSHAMIEAIESSVNFIESGRFDKIMELVQRAMLIGEDVGLAGDDFYDTPPQLPDVVIPGFFALISFTWAKILLQRG